MKIYFTDSSGTPALTSWVADAHAAVDHERRVVHQDKIGRVGRSDADARASLGAEEHDLCARLRLRLRKHGRRGQCRGAAQRQFQRIAAVDHKSLPANFLLR
jgi:hypothetical protein